MLIELLFALPSSTGISCEKKEFVKNSSRIYLKVDDVLKLQDVDGGCVSSNHFSICEVESKSGTFYVLGNCKTIQNKINESPK